MKIGIFSSPLSVFSLRGNISEWYLFWFNKSTLLKSCLAVVIISQFFISISFAQNFFPLKVGNAYQVKNFWSWWGPGGNGETGTDYYGITVLRDTLINNDTFFTFSNNALLKTNYWFLYDSLNQKFLIRLPSDTTQKLGVDFNAPSGSTYTSYLLGSPIQFTSGGITNIVVLGDTHSVYTMQSSPSSDNFIYKFADNIGLSYFKAWGGIIQAGYESEQNVISAIIDSVIYNLLVLKIDSLYPASDRPIDTFPYLMTIPYTASYSALVDSFYLDVEHFRADTLVQIKNFNLSKSNPSHLTFNLDGLHVGDKIKLRATITDTSIYNNVYHYPDTGWVIMNVLPPVMNVENENKPQSYKLAQNYPNPFNPLTKIMYQIPEANLVTIKVYDVLGNEIETLVNEEKNAGSYKVDFNGSALTSGIYYYRIITGNFSQTRKMALIK